MSTTAQDVHVEFPTESTDPTQDRESCRVVVDGEARTIRFHDYDEIFAVEGLYERIFHKHLDCRSPTEAVGQLEEALEAEGVDPATLAGIDVGAGNGLVGEGLRRLGVASLVGVDIIQASADAARRDRPEVYDDYVVCDLTALDAGQRERLCAHRPNLMTTVAALGFDDIPPQAFAEAFNLVGDGAWIAFNIKVDFLDETDRSGFRGLIAQMLETGVLDERGRRRYRHRLSMNGEPLDYVAIVGRKRADVPPAFLR